MIEDLLDSLPDDALIPLCERCDVLLRGDDARSILARIYSRSPESFLGALDEEDLLILISDQCIDVEKAQSRRSKNAAPPTAGELRQLLLDHLEPDRADRATKRRPKVGRSPFDNLTEDWSRPRKLAQLFPTIEEPASEGRREARFLDWLDDLGRQGIEVTLANSDGRPFRLGSACPSSRDDIRLRRKVSVSVGRDEKVQAPKRALNSSKPGPSPGRDEWELAVIRLRFLTAVPIADRRQQANWPHGFVEAALHGLSLPDPKRRLLATASQQFVAGNHDADALIPDILALHSRKEREQLFDHFRRLNASATDYVEQIIQLVHERLGPPRPSVIRAAAPSMRSSGRVAVIGENHANRNPPHPPIPAAPTAKPSQNDSADGTNERSLGILGDLFKTKG